jgi:hypothetical protein
MKRLTLFLLNLTSAISFLLAILLIKLRLRREPDAWRRTVGVGLRSEGSTFELDFLIRHFDVFAYATLLSPRHSPAYQLYGLGLRKLENSALLYPKARPKRHRKLRSRR